MNPVDAIQAGRRILDPLMMAARFAFKLKTTGTGSGGEFATVIYSRDNRVLEFSYRYAIGAVQYSIDDIATSHSEYMRLLGKHGQSQFRSFSRDEPMAGFVALKHDLESFGGDFLSGDGSEFLRLVNAQKQLPEHRTPPFLP